MNRMFNITVLAAALLLVSTSNGWATRTPQHTVRGVIQSIDDTTHTFTAVPAKGGEPLVFLWKDYSRLIYRGKRVCNGALTPGLAVKIYYRRETGQWVPYWVYLQNDAETRCTIGGCCGEGASGR